jgi:3-hydroxybutyryl-CoA dehydratase
VFEVVRTCGPYDPIFYAAASGDFNAIHIDREVGEKAGLGGVILHGLCTMAWATEAVVAFAGDPARVGQMKVRFTRPVRVNDTVTFRGQVTAVENGRAAGELTAVNQRGEDVLRASTFEIKLGEARS